MDASIIPQKLCPKCKQIYPLTQEYFYKNRSKKRGFSDWCKSCHLILKHEADKRRGIANGTRREELPDGFRRCCICKELKIANRDTFSTNPKNKDGLQSFCKECGAKQQREYRKANPDKVHTTDKKRNANPKRREMSRVKNKENYYRDPLRHEKTRIKNQKRRAFLVQAEGTHTKEDVQRQYMAQNGKCWWCGKELNGIFDADHLTPLSRGGSNWPNNIVCSCEFCNSSRNNRMPWEWSGRLL